jgi:intracellular sulfur oxidation DsrE/DsrF family protein
MTDWTASRRAVIGAGVLLTGIGAAPAPALAQNMAPAAGAGAGPWGPSNEALDSWMDIPGTRHRMVFDATSADGGEGAMDFANNFYFTNLSGYNLQPAQLGVIIVLRHMATPFGYNDSMWAKYGSRFASEFKWTGAKAKRAATVNPRLAADPADKVMPGAEWASDGTVTKLGEKGTRFAVCGLATQFIAMDLAKKTGSTAAAVEADLKANLVPGAVLVPAGIVAVNRAQEHGYAMAYVG